jgi:predicted nucleotidyltransferase
MMPQKKTLVKVIHGSHLYGLHTATSDLDYYVVYEFPWKIYRPKKQIDQKIDEETDTTTASLERFTDLCIKGVPQSLETLFSDSSQWLEYDNSWYYKSEEIKLLIRDEIPSILETYKRTALNFFEKDDFKKNRHALRLCLNAKDLRKTASFNPTLDPNVCEEMTRIAALPRRQREDIFKDVFYGAFGDL